MIADQTIQLNELNLSARLVGLFTTIIFQIFSQTRTNRPSPAAMAEISKEDLKKEIQDILKDADLDNTSAKKVLFSPQ